jgi:hypothetical protein
MPDKMNKDIRKKKKETGEIFRQKIEYCLNESWKKIEISNKKLSKIIFSRS